MLYSLTFRGRSSPGCRELGFASFWYNSLLHLPVIAGVSGKRLSLFTSLSPCPVDCGKKHCNKCILKLWLVLNNNGFDPIYFCESVEQNSWCWHDVPCMVILEVLHKGRFILVTWTECSLEASTLKWTFRAHHLVCYQGKVVVLCAPGQYHHMGQRPASKTPFPWYKLKI